MLSPDARSRIDREVAKYPPDQKQSAVMSALPLVIPLVIVGIVLFLWWYSRCATAQGLMR